MAYKSGYTRRFKTTCVLKKRTREHGKHAIVFPSSSPAVLPNDPNNSPHHLLWVLLQNVCRLRTLPLLIHIVPSLESALARLPLVPTPLEPRRITVSTVASPPISMRGDEGDSRTTRIPGLDHKRKFHRGTIKVAMIALALKARTVLLFYQSTICFPSPRLNAQVCASLTDQFIFAKREKRWG